MGVALALTACGGPSPSTESAAPIELTDVATSSLAPASATPTFAPPTTETATTTTTTTAAPSATTGPIVAEAIPELDIASVTDAVLIDRDRRASLDGANTFYWPDGTIGGVDLGDGHVTYFAPNGPVTTRTTGDLTDPAMRLVDAAIIIDGIADEFDYAAGGPVHFDPATGALLLWYHAERHLDGAALFHAAIGLARSLDGGATFTNLGVLIETNSRPSTAAPCCADVGGAPVVMRDGMFHLYFRDRVGPTGTTTIQLARASAPVADVLAAAERGETSQWLKFERDKATAGLGGRPSALEVGNPKTSWFDIGWHERLGMYVFVVAVHGTPTEPSTIEIATSVNGTDWSSRQVLTTCDCEATYPSFLGVLGTERLLGDVLTIAYVATDPAATFRWERTDVRKLTVTLSN